MRPELGFRAAERWLPGQFGSLLLGMGLCLGLSACAAVGRLEPVGRPASEAGSAAVDIAAARQTLAAGNALYAAGDYAGAAEAYGWLEAAGLRHPALEFNLGSACLAAGDRGCAVLALERASRLAPRDADVRRSLAVAESDSSSARAPAAWRWGRSLMSFRELQLAVLAAWSLVWLAWLLGRHRPGPGADTALGLAGLLLAGGLILLGGRLASERFRPEAVVMPASPSRLTEAPGPADPEEAGPSVEPGSRVTLLELRDGYARVRPLGRSIEGWLPAPALRRLDMP